MNSISRAVTSKINEFSNKRQRLVAEVGDFENPSWTDASTSQFNYFEPPNIIIPEQDWRETPILESDKFSPQMKSPSGGKITMKVSSVVRKLSPFSQNPTIVKVAKEPENTATDCEGSQETEKKKLFKDAREKVGKIRKSFQSKDKAQLIDSDDEA